MFFGRGDVEEQQLAKLEQEQQHPLGQQQQQQLLEEVQQEVQEGVQHHDLGHHDRHGLVHGHGLGLGLVQAVVQAVLVRVELLVRPSHEGEQQGPGRAGLFRHRHRPDFGFWSGLGRGRVIDSGFSRAGKG